MKKIKALQMSIANARGGITQYALENWRFIDKSRFAFDFVTRAPFLDFEASLKEQGCTVHHLSCSSQENEALFRKELMSILQNGYDALHLHTSFWSGYIAEELAMEAGCPKVIVHSHNTDVLSSGKQREIQRAEHQQIRKVFSSDWRRYATNLCACSQTAADWLFDENVDRADIQILRNAVDVKRFVYNEQTRNEYRRRLGLDGCFVLGHTGRFVYQKNHEFLLRVFNGLSNDFPQARLMLIGDGELIDETKAFAAEHNLSEKILFLGRRDDVAQLMQAMDVFLLPSRFEGLSLVLIEAQAAGLKCVVSENTTRESGITQNINFLPLQEDVWHKAVSDLCAGYNRSDCTEAVRHAGYSIEENIKIIEKLYEN